MAGVGGWWRGRGWGLGVGVEVGEGALDARCRELRLLCLFVHMVACMGGRSWETVERRSVVCGL